MAYYTWKSYKLNLDPYRVFSALKSAKNCFFLDSSLNPNALSRPACRAGRYSFLGIDPFFIFKTRNRDPFAKLRKYLSQYKVFPPANAPPFIGGAVGYLSYDAGFLLEKKLRKITPDDLGIPDCFFAFYNTAVIIDHFKNTLSIFTLGFPQKNNQAQKALCRDNLKKIENLLFHTAPAEVIQKENPPKAKQAQLKSDFTRRDYLAAVKKAKQYIKAGDIYQVNLSQRFQTRTNLDAPQIYQRLRSLSPSSFGAYFDAGDFQVLSSSPEGFLNLKDSIVITRPMKGTRPRGKSRKDDVVLGRQLLESAKDRAELMMIVDLERNDLGRVCSYDSIRVNKLRELEKYKTVYQTTSTIAGQLYKDKDRFDLLRAAFPGGSITGCPKIRAMEIIEELEPRRRGLYTGCLGYLSFSGNMDFNILIRTILKKQDRLYFGVGGGIVADSRPQDEYRETLVKAQAMIEAVA